MSEAHHDDEHHHHSHSLVPETVSSTRYQLDRMHIPNVYRDQCVDFHAVLKRCRAEHGTNPFFCGHERHVYEHCEYNLMQQQQAAKQPGHH